MKFKIVVLGLLFAVSSTAQNLRGIVTDDRGEPVVQANIFNKTSGMHSYTDNNGYFILQPAAVNDTLYFSSLGFETLLKIIAPADLKNDITAVLKEGIISLDQVVLSSRVDAMSRLVHIDITTDPVKSSQEILRKVPGLIIGQHAGGGKAEQLFLRGFDIDHGTDIALSVEGLPVNMVSHAHGQGYADLHFVIPETIENLQFGKGPYYANQGDFNTAGYVDLRLRKKIDQNLLSAEVGQFGTQRLTGLYQVLDQGNSSAYLASELYLTDGPFESPQNFNRINLLGRYHFSEPGDKEVSLTASHFSSKWDASGQIPQRAVDQGIIGRFGAIDDTEGGLTSRTNLVVDVHKILDGEQSISSMAYISKYDFELYSNFTFFLEDPVNGDQIKQKENRLIAGAKTEFKNWSSTPNVSPFAYTAGLGFRYDKVVDNELSHTRNRAEILNRLAWGNVDQVNTFAYANASLLAGKFAIEPAIRLDYFKFDYLNKLSDQYDNQSREKVALSPKLNTVFNPNRNTQIFLKTGVGFHSNDARVVIANNGEEILPAAYGVDLGTIIKPADRVVLNATFWSLFLNQEFVYVGDAAVVEPSGRTRRLGLELGARYNPYEWLYVYSDATLTKGRSVDEPEGANYIPLAPDFTLTGGLVFGNTSQGLSGGINYRYIDDRPANETNSIVAAGYFIADTNINLSHKNWTFGVIIENLFDSEWNETQFATESRLLNEISSVEEIHFTPGTPFFLKGKVKVTF